MDQSDTKTSTDDGDSDDPMSALFESEVGRALDSIATEQRLQPMINRIKQTSNIPKMPIRIRTTTEDRSTRQQQQSIRRKHTHKSSLPQVPILSNIHQQPQPIRHIPEHPQHHISMFFPSFRRTSSSPSSSSSSSPTVASSSGASSPTSSLDGFPNSFARLVMLNAGHPISTSSSSPLSSLSPSSSSVSSGARDRDHDDEDSCSFSGFPAMRPFHPSIDKASTYVLPVQIPSPVNRIPWDNGCMLRLKLNDCVYRVKHYIPSSLFINDENKKPDWSRCTPLQFSTCTRLKATRPVKGRGIDYVDQEDQVFLLGLYQDPALPPVLVTKEMANMIESKYAHTKPQKRRRLKQLIHDNNQFEVPLRTGVIALHTCPAWFQERKRAYDKEQQQQTHHPRRSITTNAKPTKRKRTSVNATTNTTEPSSSSEDTAEEDGDEESETERKYRN